jgi:hypothetical protein
VYCTLSLHRTALTLSRSYPLFSSFPIRKKHRLLRLLPLRIGAFHALSKNLLHPGSACAGPKAQGGIYSGPSPRVKCTKMSLSKHNRNVTLSTLEMSPLGIHRYVLSQSSPHPHLL